MPQHYISFWNLENLFAPESFAGREPWIAKVMRRDLTGWTDELFKRKIAQLSSIIVQMNGGMGPDILGVCEVENKYCLEQLIANLNGLLVERDYGIVHADATLDRRGIDTAFIYDKHKFSFDPDTLFSYFVMRRTGTRDITQVTFTTASGNELVALCNHWPSRSGGAYESQGYRMTAGETLSYWHQRIWEIKGNDIPIIAMGDLNDDPFDLSVQVHARATRERGDVERTRSAPRFYNLAWNYLEQEVIDRKGRPKTINGTLYWSGNGNLFDQILVSKGLVQDDGPLKVLADSAQIEAYPEMTDHRVSYGPIRFGLPKGDVEKYINKDGFSDHYPVSVLVEETVPEN